MGVRCNGEMHYMLFCRDEAVWQFDDGTKWHATLKLIKEKTDIIGHYLKASHCGILDMAKSAMLRKAKAHMARYLATNVSISIHNDNS